MAARWPTMAAIVQPNDRELKQTNFLFVWKIFKKKWKSANNNLIEMFVWSENIKTGFPIFCQTSPTGGTWVN